LGVRPELKKEEKKDAVTESLWRVRRQRDPQYTVELEGRHKSRQLNGGKKKDSSKKTPLGWGEKGSKEKVERVIKVRANGRVEIKNKKREGGTRERRPCLKIGKYAQKSFGWVKTKAKKGSEM